MPYTVYSGLSQLRNWHWFVPFHHIVRAQLGYCCVQQCVTYSQYKRQETVTESLFFFQQFSICKYVEQENCVSLCLVWMCSWVTGVESMNVYPREIGHSSYRYSGRTNNTICKIKENAHSKNVKFMFQRIIFHMFHYLFRHCMHVQNVLWCCVITVVLDSWTDIESQSHIDMGPVIDSYKAVGLCSVNE